MFKSLKTIPSIIWLILAFAFIKGLCYLSQIPPWQSPDEANHFVFIRELMINGTQSIRQPVSSQEIFNEVKHSMDTFKFNDISPNVNIIINKEERPPLYYFINHAILKLFNVNELIKQFYICRFFSLTLGLGTIILGHFITRIAFPENPALSIGVPLSISFLPQFNIVYSSVNPDSLENLLSALFILFILKTIQAKNSIWIHVAIALIITLSLLTKRTAIVFIPVWFITILLSQRKTVVFYIITTTCILLAIFIKTVIPETLVNFQDPFQELPRYFNATIISLSYWLKFHEHLFVTFTGVFGWLKFPLPGVWYYLIALFTVIAIISNVQFLLKSGMNFFHLPKLLILLTIIAITYMSILLVYGIRYRTPPQGRYLFPAIIPIMIFINLGLNRLKCKQKFKFYLVGFFITLFSLDIFIMLHYIFSSFKMFLPS